MMSLISARMVADAVQYDNENGAPSFTHHPSLLYRRRRKPQQTRYSSSDNDEKEGCEEFFENDH